VSTSRGVFPNRKAPFSIGPRQSPVQWISGELQAPKKQERRKHLPPLRTSTLGSSTASIFDAQITIRIPTHFYSCLGSSIPLYAQRAKRMEMAEFELCNTCSSPLLRTPAPRMYDRSQVSLTLVMNQERPRRDCDWGSSRLLEMKRLSRVDEIGIGFSSMVDLPKQICRTVLLTSSQHVAMLHRWWPYW
jgi:hypothetical protein